MDNTKYGIVVDNDNNFLITFNEGEFEGFTVCITHIEDAEVENDKGEMETQLIVDYHVEFFPEDKETYDPGNLREAVETALLEFLHQFVNDLENGEES